MATIAEADIMLVSVWAAKALTSVEYSMEVHNALGRIADAMYQNKGEITITRLQDNPVERDVAIRSTLNVIEMYMGLEGK